MLGPVNNARHIDIADEVQGPTLRRGGGQNTHEIVISTSAYVLMSSANAKVVQQRLGHHSAAFTLDVYTTVMVGFERQSASRAAEIIGSDLDADDWAAG